MESDPNSTDRVMGADAAYAVGRFEPNGPTGYRAATAPDAPLRTTRAAAVDDERAWLCRSEVNPAPGGKMSDFWEAIDAQLEALKTATSADEVLAICPTIPDVSSGEGFFAGGGGDYTPIDSLREAGWATIWAEAPYHYALRAPDGSAITYVEGDLYLGDCRA